MDNDSLAKQARGIEQNTGNFFRVCLCEGCFKVVTVSDTMCQIANIGFRNAIHIKSADGSHRKKFLLPTFSTLDSKPSAKC